MWNSLPDTFRQCSSYNQFRSLIDQWNGPVCNCSACARKGALTCWLARYNTT
ncbi:hypothetical protein DPMN_099708 [Dreissena polymorpha]|uniref:Uncharacterized protein n=1 Tax=Dreissena polymorpha TaxID=45954 RepID=A0A9D4LG08_DREPO|nr:hypothetical protein DPMN_099708 [Dreissena polymorpha]